jgi:hypothetical protein
VKGRCCLRHLLTQPVRRILVVAFLAAAVVPSTAEAGFFRVMQDHGVWWLVGPDGNRFFSTGVNEVGAGDLPPTGTPRETAGYVGLLHYPDFSAWWSATANRLRAWGFNTLGGWAEDGAIAKHEMPYVVSLHLGKWVGAPWEDVTAPDALETIRTLVRSLAQYRDDPQLIGYFIDNELGWYDDAVFEYWANRPAANRGRQTLFNMLQEEYGSDRAAFLRDFVVDPPPAAPSDLKLLFSSRLRVAPGRRPTVVYRFVEWVADEYYRVLASEVRRVDPNHLLLGDRFAGYYSQSVARAAGKWMDVVSVNFSSHTRDGWISPAFLDSLARLTGKPLMVTEFYAAAMENRSGNKNSNGPFLVVQTQKERAQAAAAMAEQLARLPFVVGYHWFGWADEPSGGRSDGEDFNMGLVDVENEPYEELTAALARVNRDASRLHGDGLTVRGPARSDGMAVVPSLSAPLVLDGRLDEWNGRASWLEGGGARLPWLPFADFYLAWQPEGLLVGSVYYESWDGDDDTVPPVESHRLIVTFAGAQPPTRTVVLAECGETEGPRPAGIQPERGGASAILPLGRVSAAGPGAFEGIRGAQWSRSLTRTREILIPAGLFGKAQLVEGDDLQIGLSLVMSGEGGETFWPSSQEGRQATGAPPPLARLRLGAAPTTPDRSQ